VVVARRGAGARHGRARLTRTWMMMCRFEGMIFS
jgi:hypothetical protein